MPRPAPARRIASWSRPRRVASRRIARRPGLQVIVRDPYGQSREIRLGVCRTRDDTRRGCEKAAAAIVRYSGVLQGPAVPARGDYLGWLTPLSGVLKRESRQQWRCPRPLYGSSRLQERAMSRYALSPSLRPPSFHSLWTPLWPNTYPRCKNAFCQPNDRFSHLFPHAKLPFASRLNFKRLV